MLLSFIELLIINIPNTKYPIQYSRKLCKRKPQLLPHCGSFDLFDLQWLNKYRVFFLYFENVFNKIRACNIPLDRHFQDLSKSILQVPTFR